jgi:peptidoglycan/xylan/chitin deacetylase (PgdA/CDA1 family)
MKRFILKTLFKSTFFSQLHRCLNKTRLTVIAYHRIVDHQASDFDLFRPNVSATPATFAEQLDYLQAHYHVISLPQLLNFLQKEGDLPPYPALITFDDGYYDNFEHAVPALLERNLPATIFLATDYVNSPRFFPWDLVAYCFHHTPLNAATLPYLGFTSWHDQSARQATATHLVSLYKQLPEQTRCEAVASLPHLLQVTIPSHRFKNLMMNWNEVRIAANANSEAPISFGAHTETHPILTHIPPAQAQAEIIGSKRRIEAELDTRVRAFAYPNGSITDFTPKLQQVVENAGIQAAFTLIPKIHSLTDIKNHPLTIPRIPIDYQDTLPHFAAKLLGFMRTQKNNGSKKTGD